jgi:hypothetical protein
MLQFKFERRDDGCGSSVTHRMTNLIWAAPGAKVVFLCAPSITVFKGQNMCDWARDYYIPIYLKHLQMVSPSQPPPPPSPQFSPPLLLTIASQAGALLPAPTELSAGICVRACAPACVCGMDVADFDSAAAWTSRWRTARVQRRLEAQEHAANRGHSAALYRRHGPASGLRCVM